MWKKRRLRISLLCCAGCMAVVPLAAAEHHGNVTFGGLPVPGATVTATQGDKKVTAVTDPQGAYTFADLADGAWSMQVEMLCFAPIKQDVNVAAGAAAAEWKLTLLPLDDLKAAAAAAPSVAMPAAPPPQPRVAVNAETPAAKPGKPGKGKSKKGAEQGATANGQT